MTDKDGKLSQKTFFGFVGSFIGVMVIALGIYGLYIDFRLTQTEKQIAELRDRQVEILISIGKIEEQLSHYDNLSLK